MVFLFFLFFLSLISITLSEHIINIRVLTMNRHLSLKRLLSSLNLSNFDNDIINMEIFIDASPENNKTCQQTMKIVNEFVWKFGEKRIVENKINLGHIKQWFQRPMSKKPFFIFEDDLILSPDFYLIIKNILRQNIIFGLKQKMIGISLGNLRYVILDDNCKHFKPKKCMEKYIIPENSSYFINQFEPWGPLVFSEKWHELADYYENNENQKKKEIHCIPNALSNIWYNASDTFAQYFMFKNGLFFMFFNTKTKIVHNFREKGLHFNGSNLDLDYNLLRLEKNNLILSTQNFFDFGFNRINGLIYKIPVAETINLNYTQKCNVRYKYQ